MGSLNHFTQQVEGKLRVHLIGFTGMIGPAVMAFGEHGDRVYMTCTQHGLELGSGEVPANAGNGF